MNEVALHRARMVHSAYPTLGCGEHEHHSRGYNLATAEEAALKLMERPVGG